MNVIYCKNNKVYLRSKGSYGSNKWTSDLQQASTYTDSGAKMAINSLNKVIPRQIAGGYAELHRAPRLVSLPIKISIL